MLRLKRFERILIENRRFCSNGVSLANWPKMSGTRVRLPLTINCVKKLE